MSTGGDLKLPFTILSLCMVLVTGMSSSSYLWMISGQGLTAYQCLRSLVHCYSTNSQVPQFWDWNAISVGSMVT